MDLLRGASKIYRPVDDKEAQEESLEQNYENWFLNYDNFA